MGTAPVVTHLSCPSCGASLSRGVCASCALSDLLPEFRRDETALDMTFGRYLLKKKLASGGMGVVYRAEDQKLKRTVALKMIKGSTFASDADMARFTIETEAAAALDHPNITPMYEVGVLEEQPFFTMKLISGGSLATRLKEASGHRLSPQDAAQWLSSIARAVQHAHERGVLHRDLKPGNILIDESGKSWLTDFGLAKLVHQDSGLTMSSDRLGTPHYMAPEVVQDNARSVSTASDVWALGVILWQSLTGELPFKGTGPVDIMRKIVEEEPSLGSMSGLDRDLLTLAQRCLEKDPKRRLASADEFANELDRWLRGEPLLVRRITSGERLWKWVKRNPAWAALVLALVAGGLSSLRQWSRAESAVDSLTETNTQLSRSLTLAKSTQLALEAQAQVTQDPIVSLLLASKAAETTDPVSERVLPVAAEALYETLREVGGTDVSPSGHPLLGVRAGDGFINRFSPREHAPCFSPDGQKVFLVEHEGQQVMGAVYDLGHIDGPQLLAKWPVWEKGPNDTAKSACWLQDSERLVSVSRSGEVVCWSPNAEATAQKRLLGNLAFPGKSICRVALTSSEEVGTLHGYVIFEGPKDNPDTVLQFLRVTPQSTDPIALSEPQTFRPLPILTHRHYQPSSTLKWLYVQGISKRSLVRFDFESETHEWVDLGPMTTDGVCSFAADETRMILREDNGLGVTMLALSDAPLEMLAADLTMIISHPITIEYLALSADGLQMAFSDSDQEVYTASLSETSKAKPRWLAKGDEQLFMLSFSEDGRWLSGGSLAQVVMLWPLDETGSRNGDVIRLRGSPTPIVKAFFSPGDEHLIAFGTIGVFRHWKFSGLNKGAQPTLRRHEADQVHDLAVSPDGQWVATAHENANGSEHPITLLRLADQAQRVLHKSPKGVTGVAWSPGGKWLASTGTDGFAKVWHFPEIADRWTHGGVLPSPSYQFDMTHTRLQYSRQLAFHPAGRLYVTSGDGILFEWDLRAEDPVASRKEHPLHSINYLLPDIAISPKGDWLAVARHGWDREEGEDKIQRGNMVLLYDASDPNKLEFSAALPANFYDQTNLSFSPDGRWLAVGSAGEPAKVWDLQAPDIAASQIQSPISDHLFRGVAFSPSGEWLGLGGNDGRFHLWDWRTDELRSLATDGGVVSIEWVDGTRLITGETGGQVSLWETGIEPLKQLARKVAGRSLTPDEQTRFGSQ